MSEESRILHREPPLTNQEKDARYDHATRIQVDHSATRVEIRRNWVESERGGQMGYAEAREYTRTDKTELDLIVVGRLDMLALTKAIVAEVERQHKEEEARHANR